MLVVQGTLKHPSRRFNEHTHHWESLDPRANIFGQNGQDNLSNMLLVVTVPAADMRRHSFGIALLSLMPVVRYGTPQEIQRARAPLRATSLDPRANIFGQNGPFEQ
jgi:hypothetical protein